MAGLARKIPFSCSAALNGVRHGHMVKLQGNKWDTRDWPRKKQRWTPIKGTKMFKLDTIRPPDDLLHETEDPKIVEYSYQLDSFPRTKNSDAVEYLCALTKTARPLLLSDVNHSIDSEFLSDFVAYVEESCDSFNRLFYQKGIRLSKYPTPLELDNYAKLYASGFLQNMLNFTFSSSHSGELLSNSHQTTNVRTSSFWRHEVLQSTESHLQCYSFQLNNFIDIMLRSVRPLSYQALRGDTNSAVVADWSRKDMYLPNLCTKRLNLFKEKREVEQYPGFIKETLYPYNHTLFKVVSSALSDRDLQATAMMTGFGQTVATTQHRLDFPCRIDLLPEVERSEAVNVIVTDGNRYCLGVYQCNTTNMCGTQLEDAHVNCCALSEVQTIVKDGLVNEQLLGGMLGMLTSQSHELETDVLLQSESEAVQI